MRTTYVRYFMMLAGAAVLLTGCFRDNIDPAPDIPEGKKVTVSIKVSVPRAQEVKGTAVSKGLEPHKSFSVELESSDSGPVTRSDGKTKLYNLWMFQFNADGSLNAKPYKISDEVTAVNDMVMLEVPLTVATNQTLYLVATGAQINDDLTSVKSLSDLESWEFAYTISQGGGVRSRITSDEEIPFAGKVSGANVLDIDGGSKGLVEYNTPDGFAGNIPIKRLMAHIKLRYKFDVPDYILEGMKLLNAGGVIRIANPDKNPDTDSYVTLDPYLSAPDADGYVTATWYVAQNAQGTVPTILTETDRYYKLIGTTPSGNAPKLGCNIEAWAYSKSQPDNYAIYQMYVGLNNTSNFDVLPNKVYNMRTTINTEIGSAKNDGRIRAYTVKQTISIRPSAVISGFSPGAGKFGDRYDFDAHFDVRPVIVTTKGTTVTIGIYKDEACTQLVDPKTSWLKLSSSSNYTDAYNNTREPLGAQIETKVILPTELKFYLYSDEFVLDENGRIMEPETRRRLYVKVVTKTKTEEGGDLIRQSGVYAMDQVAAIYAGNFGGQMENGKYTKGLFRDFLFEGNNQYSDEAVATVAGLPWGYMGITFPAKYDVTDTYNGRNATRQLAENPDGLVINGHAQLANLKAPRKLANGNIDLYQYSYYNSFVARFCYDRNRDENGDGVIDDNELKWYVPSARQGLGIVVSMYFPNSLASYHGYGMSSTNTHGTDNAYSFSATMTSGGALNYGSRTGAGLPRCVREVDMNKLTVKGQAPIVYVYTDDKGNTYGAINSENLPRNVENRAANPDFYVKNIPLYYYIKDGLNAVPVLDGGGNQVLVERVRRNEVYVSRTAYASVNRQASSNFVVAPKDISATGETGTTKDVNMSWATANGYLETANSQDPTMEASAADRGCAYYKGKDNDPNELGKWRNPTQKEAALILIYEEKLLDATGQTGFEGLVIGGTYWICTEGDWYPNAWMMKSLRNMNTPNNYSAALYYSGSNKTFTGRLRCIKDIPPTN